MPGKRNTGSWFVHGSNGWRLTGAVLLLLVLLQAHGDRLLRLAAYGSEERVVIDVDLPFSSAGGEGETLALRIFAPAGVEGGRYPDGAPVVIQVPGSDGGGSLDEPITLADDLVRIAFLLPEGVNRVTGRSSGSEIDYWGKANIKALHDVVLYAAGELPDIDGRRISDLLSVPVIGENIGLYGAGNGTGLALAAMAFEGKDLALRVKYLVQSEKPAAAPVMSSYARESASLYREVAAQAPGLEAMILVGATDRERAAARENDQVRLAFEALTLGGIWVRLNPSRRYLVAFGQTVAARSDLPDNMPNSSPANWAERARYGYPEDLIRHFQAAAVREMADRVHLRTAPPEIEIDAETVDQPATTGLTTTNPPTPLPTPIPGGAHGTSPHWSAGVEVGGTDGISCGTQSRGIAAGRNNRLFMVWSELTWNNYDIFYTTSANGGLSWTRARDIGQTNAGTTSPGIAIGPDDGVHVVWVDRRNFGPARIYYSRSGDYGTTFITPLDISGPAQADVGPPSISVDARNRVHIAWHIGNPDQPGGNQAQVYYTSSANSGTNFEPPRRLNSGSWHAGYPRFSVEKTTGEVVAIAWRDNRRFPDWDIYAAISTDGGQRFVERPVIASPLREYDPDLVVDRTGNLHLVYMTWRTSQSMATPAAISIDYRRSSDYGVSWSTPISLSEIRSQMPFILRDKENNRLWAFWRDERDAPPGNVTEFKSDLACRFSLDGGETWSSPEFITDLGDLDVRFPSVAVGSEGKVHATWSDRRFGAMREKVFFATRRWSEF